VAAMKLKRADKRAGSGFTLIELMVAMAITGIVVAALIEVFRNYEISYTQASEGAKLQANARTALKMISDDIRMAAFTGIPLGGEKMATSNQIYMALSIKDGSNKASKPSATNTLAQELTAFDDTSDSKHRPDAIEVKGNFARRTTTVTSVSGDEITVEDAEIFDGAGFEKPGWIVVGSMSSSPIRYEILSVTKDSTGSGGMVKVSGNAGSINNMIAAPFFRRVYFVKQKEGTAAVNGLFARNYRGDLATSPFDEIQLATGVRDLQFTYDLIDKDNDARLVVNQNLVTNPCLIRNVTVTLTTISEKFRPKDRPLLMDTSTTARVRNMGFDSPSCELP
jgi:prepilin-type N-terminal cleavage/methylation domain-containing protein